MDLLEVGWGAMDRTDMAEDRGSWRALLKAVMNIWVS